MMVAVVVMMMMMMMMCAADVSSTDKLNATAWDYARARQLHYCMLIIASYLRQSNRGSQSHRDYTHDHRDFTVTNQSSLFDSQQLQVGHLVLMLYIYTYVSSHYGVVFIAQFIRIPRYTM